MHSLFQLRDMEHHDMNAVETVASKDRPTQLHVHRVTV